MTTTYSELQVHNATNSVRRERDIRINDISWRIERNQRELRLGLEPTDSTQILDQYIQDLCNVPKQAGFPFEVEWPAKP
jgi:hypothetical protein